MACFTAGGVLGLCGLRESAVGKQKRGAKSSSPSPVPPRYDEGRGGRECGARRHWCPARVECVPARWPAHGQLRRSGGEPPGGADRGGEGLCARAHPGAARGSAGVPRLAVPHPAVDPLVQHAVAHRRSDCRHHSGAAPGAAVDVVCERRGARSTVRALLVVHRCDDLRAVCHVQGRDDRAGGGHVPPDTRRDPQGDGRGRRQVLGPRDRLGARVPVWCDHTGHRPAAPRVDRRVHPGACGERVHDRLGAHHPGAAAAQAVRAEGRQHERVHVQGGRLLPAAPAGHAGGCGVRPLVARLPLPGPLGVQHRGKAVPKVRPCGVLHLGAAQRLCDHCVHHRHAPVAARAE